MDSRLTGWPVCVCVWAVVVNARYMTECVVAADRYLMTSGASFYASLSERV